MDYASDSSSSSDEVGAFIGFPFAATPLPGGLGRYPFAPAPVSNGIGAPLHFANGLRAPLPFANGLGAPLPYSAGLGNYPNVAAPFPNGLGGYPNMAAPNWDETNGHSEETEEVVDESWSKRELKDECGRRGFRSFNRLNKERLIRLLNGEPAPPTYNPPAHDAHQRVTPPNQHSVGGTGTVDTREPSSSSNERAGQSGETERPADGSWSKRELKYECWKRGIKNFNRLNKYALIRLLNDGGHARRRAAHGGSANATQTSGYAASSPSSNERPDHSEETAGSSWPGGSRGGEGHTRQSPAGGSAGPYTRISESAMPTDRGDNRDGRAVDAGETNAYPAEGGGNGAYPTAASSHANERTGQAEWGSEFVAPGTTPQDHHSKTNSKGLKNSDNTCIVCMDNEVNCTLVPCGHHCTCINCAAEFQQCPVCRTNVDQKIKTYGA